MKYATPLLVTLLAFPVLASAEEQGSTRAGVEAGCTSRGGASARGSEVDVCGDSEVTDGETCDDGNTQRADGCSAECQTEQALDAPAQACVMAQNKAVATVSKVANKTIAKCVKTHVQGKNEFETCYGELYEDGGSVEKVLDKLVVKTEAQCEGIVPAFGPQEPIFGIAYALQGSTALVVGLLDAPPQIVVTEPGASCQAAVLKGSIGVVNARLSAFNKCKKAALAGKTLPQAISGADLEGCALHAGEKGEAKVNAAHGKLADDVTAACAGQTISSVVPETCDSSADTDELSDCIGRHAECIACAVISLADEMTPDCDLVDDGVANDTCP